MTKILNISKKSYSHLDFRARDRLQSLWDEGCEQQEIAKILNVHKSTVSREMSRHKLEDGTYCASAAEHKAGVSRSESKYQGMKIEANPKLKQHLIDEMTVMQSPDGIAGRDRDTKEVVRVATTTIYRWLYSPFGQQHCHLLCTKRYKKKVRRTKPKREMIKNMKSIHHIPQKISDSGNISEGDTFLSPKKAKTTTAVAVVVKQRSTFISGNKIPSMETECMTRTMQEIQRVRPSDALILDRGIENRGHETYGLPVYFCDPHAPWEKPLVEGGIGLVRRWFFPKGTNLDLITEEELQESFRILNSKYKKSLQYRSAAEVEKMYDMMSTLTEPVAVH